MPPIIATGDETPGLSLAHQNGKTHALAEYRGEHVALDRLGVL